MKHYELLVFDWDGTIVDSAGEIVSAMQQAIQGLGLPERTPDQMRELIGLGFNDVLARLFPDFDTQRLRTRLSNYRRRYGSQYATATLFPPVMAALETLHGRGYTLAVATGKSRRGLEAALDRTETRRFFAYTRCADESIPKPAPAMLEELLLRNATLPEHALMVGDTEYDMAMAAAAGVDAVGVGSGVHDEQRLREAGAITVFPTLEALPVWLNEPRD